MAENFFAASAENAKAFVDTCEQVYYEMLQKNFITTKGDEFILSLAANEMRESIKNAGAYILSFLDWCRIQADFNLL